MYDDVPVGEVPDEAVEAICSFLKVHPGVTFTAKSLAEKVGLPTRGTQVEVRKAVTTLLFRGERIVSNEKGFLYTDDDTLLRKYVRDLEHRRAGLDARIAAVKKLFPVGQTVLASVVVGTGQCSWCGADIPVQDATGLCRFCRAEREIKLSGAKRKEEVLR